jgi:signal peptidase
MTIVAIAPAGGTAVGRRVLRTSARLLLDLAMLIAVAAFVALAIGPRLLPYQTVTMLSGSMQPTVPTGSLAIDVSEPVSALRVGQVITFHAPVPGDPVVTHRVVSVERRDGRVLIRTKGDANSGDDPWHAVVRGDRVWRERAALPWIGSAIHQLRQPTAHLVTAWALPFAALGWFLAALWRPAVKGGGRRWHRDGRHAERRRSRPQPS